MHAAIAQHPGDIAGLMVTNPSTLGRLFEEQIAEITAAGACGGRVCTADGANFNGALLGKVRPGDTVSTACTSTCTRRSPRRTAGRALAAAGGWRRGPVPFPTDADGGKRGDSYTLNFDRPAVHRAHAQLFGNFGMMVRAYTYIREMAAPGLTQATEMAVLNAVLSARPHRRHHPCCARAAVDARGGRHRPQAAEERDRRQTLRHRQAPDGLRLPSPTVYFPLGCPARQMIEPTETESKETLDEFAEAPLHRREAATTPSWSRLRPQHRALRRLDETRAARHRLPGCRWPRRIGWTPLQRAFAGSPRARSTSDHPGRGLLHHGLHPSWRNSARSLRRRCCAETRRRPAHRRSSWPRSVAQTSTPLSFGRPGP